MKATNLERRAIGMDIFGSLPTKREATGITEGVMFRRIISELPNIIYKSHDQNR